MRLTLRTLLAYLDDVLDAKDAERLKQKIHDSEIATMIVQRIETTLRRPRLNAPPLDGRGLGADPNSVAEYLDNTLAIEKVPEFERVCLESDMQLAEAAACHKILTLVLSTPAEVPNELRQRIYELGVNSSKKTLSTDTPISLSPGADGSSRRLDPKHGQPYASRVAAGDSPNSTDDSISDREDQENFDADQSVPATRQKKGKEQLSSEASTTRRSASGKLSRVDPGIAESSTRSASDLSSDELDDPSMENSSGDLDARDLRSARRETLRQGGLDLSRDDYLAEVPEYVRGRRSGWGRVLFSALLLVLMLIVAWQAIGPLDRAWQLLNQGTVASSSEQAGSQSDNVASRENASASPPTEQPAANNSPTEPPLANLPSPNLPSPNVPSELNPENRAASFNNSLTESNEVAGDINQNSAPPSLLPGPMTDPATDPTPSLLPSEAMPSDANPASPSLANPAPANSLGQGIAGAWNPTTDDGKNETVLVVTSDRQQLIRAAVGNAFPNGSKIIIPPATRPDIQLDPGLVWTGCGPTDMTLLGANQDGIAQVRMEQGRAIVSTLNAPTPDTQGSLVLEVGGQPLVIRLLDAQSVAAIDARWYAIPGLTLDAPNCRLPVVVVMVVAGGVEVIYSDVNATTATSATLEIGQGIGLVAGAPAERFPLQAIPTWFRTSAERPIDRQAASDLQRALPQGEDVSIKLREQLGNRRMETVALAAQTLTLLDDYSWVSGTSGLLNQEKARPHWNVLIDAIAARATSSVERATLLKTSLMEQESQRGPFLFSLLSLPSQEQLAGEGAEAIVNLLESPHLDERVLAIRILKKATEKDHGFQPERPSKGVIQEWRRSQRIGEIIYTPKTWPTPLPEGSTSPFAAP